jgi:hypothetical protein
MDVKSSELKSSVAKFGETTQQYIKYLEAAESRLDELDVDHECPKEDFVTCEECERHQKAQTHLQHNAIHYLVPLTKLVRILLMKSCPNPHCENGRIKGTAGVGCATCNGGQS